MISQRTYALAHSSFAEEPDRYKQGGLHPIVIGDTLRNGRYRIIHKLGSGGTGTVWLSRDTIENRYVSLKIQSADTPIDGKELQIMQTIAVSTVVHRGREFVVQLLDHFFVDGPNGKHHCLVMKVAGDHLARKSGLPFNSLEWPRKIGLQIAQALGFLHSLDLAHGDCFPSNILFQLQSFDDWSEEEIYACMGQPTKHPIHRLDGQARGDRAPEYILDPGNVVALQNRLHTDRILLIDLGTAFEHGEVLDHIFTPPPYASPEIVFSGELTYQVDKWAFGCVLYELCADQTLIKSLFGAHNDARKDHVAMLGKPPEALWRNWEERHKYFQYDGSPKEAEGRRLKVKWLSLEQRVRNSDKPVAERGYDKGEEDSLRPEFQELYDLFREIITYDAQARLSFDEIVSHPFFSEARIAR